MPEPHHDPISDNIETHPVKLAIWVVLGAFALIVGLVLLAKLAIGLHGTRSLEGDAAMAPAMVAQRIAPVAKLEIDPNAPPPVPAPAAKMAAAAPAAAKGDAPAKGKAVYDATCSVCHAAGIAGAPKAGDKAAWAGLAKGGKEALVASAIKGKGAMPPRGGNATLSDADVKAAVEYLLAAAK